MFWYFRKQKREELSSLYYPENICLLNCSIFSSSQADSRLHIQCWNQLGFKPQPLLSVCRCRRRPAVNSTETALNSFRVEPKVCTTVTLGMTRPHRHPARLILLTRPWPTARVEASSSWCHRRSWSRPTETMCPTRGIPWAATPPCASGPESTARLQGKLGKGANEKLEEQQVLQELEELQKLEALLRSFVGLCASNL